MIKGIIFDMDGVLVDNRDIHVEAFRQFSRRRGIDFDERALIEAFGRANDEIIPRIWPREAWEGADIEALSREKEDIYREIFREKVEPTPGLVAFIDRALAHGYRLAVGSSGPSENVCFVLEACGIADRFAAVVSGDMAERCKPAPDIYLMAAGLLGLTPAECMVVEDAPPGMEAARAAGCRLAVLATTFPRSRFADEKYDLISGNFTDFDFEAIASL